MAKAKPLSPIGVQIDAIRQRRHELTLYRLAKNAEMNYSQFFRMMRGKPTRDSLIRICKALRCDVGEANEIFSLTDYRFPTQDELDEAISKRRSSAAA